MSLTISEFYSPIPVAKNIMDTSQLEKKSNTIQITKNSSPVTKITFGGGNGKTSDNGVCRIQFSGNSSQIVFNSKKGSTDNVQPTNDSSLLNKRDINNLLI